MTQKAAEYAKAIAAAIATGLTYFISVLAPEATFDTITMIQWFGFFVAVLGSFGAVAMIPNKKPVPTVAATEYIGKHRA